MEQDYVPGVNVQFVTDRFQSYVPKFMRLWRGSKAQRLTNIPLTQLVAMKLVVNQAYDNMGLQGKQTLGPILDSIMRNTPEGREFVHVAARGGVAGAIEKRDGPFGDYSQARREQQPMRRSELGL